MLAELYCRQRVMHIGGEGAEGRGPARSRLVVLQLGNGAQLTLEG